MARAIMEGDILYPTNSPFASGCMGCAKESGVDIQLKRSTRRQFNHASASNIAFSMHFAGVCTQ